MFQIRTIGPTFFGTAETAFDGNAQWVIA